MANHKSALKRHRQSLVARARNRARKTRVKTAIKAVRSAIDANNLVEAREALVMATKVIDKAASKKVFHWRAASRKVSRLAAAVNKLES